MNQPVYMASLRRWLTNPGIVIGVVILSLVVAVAVAAPWLYTIDPNAMDPSNSLQAPGVRAEFITLGGESFHRLCEVVDFTDLLISLVFAHPHGHQKETPDRHDGCIDESRPHGWKGSEKVTQSDGNLDLCALRVADEIADSNQ